MYIIFFTKIMEIKKLYLIFFIEANCNVQWSPLSLYSYLNCIRIT